MKVVCIDNKGISRPDLPLTIGKVYETSGGPPAQYTIICDDGISRGVSTRRFISVEDWRDKQLDKIL
jgi:hypothetical protein